MRLPFDGSQFPEARDWVEARALEGCQCPACGQYARIYHRPLNSGQARCLRLMLALHSRGEEWVQASTIAKRMGNSGSDFSLLQHWEAIEPKPATKGWWRLTSVGSNFARGAFRLPRHADIYDGNLLQLDYTETVHIRDLLGDHFDRDELLAGVASIKPETPP